MEDPLIDRVRVLEGWITKPEGAATPAIIAISLAMPENAARCSGLRITFELRPLNEMVIVQLCYWIFHIGWLVCNHFSTPNARASAFGDTRGKSAISAGGSGYPALTMNVPARCEQS